MNCLHHGSYNPKDGEPEGTIRFNIGMQNAIPCPYCWQEYAKFQTMANKVERMYQ